ncbi:hypothetical protein LPTSP2_39230 [Leptospira ellinghausenii]|uniref:Uncharacterized protein n=1 Tax=Leptospira ellinghausenii TaxID=1917822 RepID=A0A2P2DJ83_9LEPT|nr:hypothetical protein [Leptospira ellinghausenii]GBF44620.1 hypothetical protein LPTSP2_39230 [Leptospira ellinghausenii]
MPDDYRINEKYKNVAEIEFYLETVFFAANTKTSTINMFKFPNIKNCKQLMPAELYFAISNFLSLIETSPQKLPIPKQEIDLDHIKKFETIIESNLFQSYCESHNALEYNDIEFTIAIDNLKNKGKNLYNRHIDSILLKDMAISVLPITEKIIGTIFGKIPGSISKFASKILTDYLKTEKKIVIYQLDGLFKTILTDVVFPYVRGR